MSEKHAALTLYVGLKGCRYAYVLGGVIVVEERWTQPPMGIVPDSRITLSRADVKALAELAKFVVTEPNR